MLQESREINEGGRGSEEAIIRTRMRATLGDFLAGDKTRYEKALEVSNGKILSCQRKVAPVEHHPNKRKIREGCGTIQVGCEY